MRAFDEICDVGDRSADPDAAPTCIGCLHLCGALPRDDCRAADEQPGRATIEIERSSAHRGSVRIRWPGATATEHALGSPLFDTSYALCVYDGGAAEPVLEAQAAPGHGWARISGGGFEYEDPSAPWGLTDARLALKRHGEATIVARGAGAKAVPTRLPLTLPVTAQLVTSEGACWQVRFDTQLANSPSAFVAKSRGPKAGAAP